MSNLPQLGEWDSFEELAKLQDAQLPDLLECVTRTQFWRERGAELDGQTPREQLESAPLTTKDDLRGAYPFGMLAVEKSDLATYHESSGTAGTPTPSFYTEQDWEDLTDRYARKWVGIEPEDLFMVRTPYALMVTGHLAQAAARTRGATVVPADNRSLAMPYARVVRILHDLGITLTWSMASETLTWAAAAEEIGLSPSTDFPDLRALFVGGDPLSRGKRQRISEIWNVPVVEEYGSTETGSLAGGCPEGALHLWADRAIFEVHDPETGQNHAEGDGQLVVTPLYRRAMPLLRYNLGDDVHISYKKCPCGWALPTISVYGRSAFAYRVRGSGVTQDALEDSVFSMPLEARIKFWRARALPERLELQIECPDADQSLVTDLGDAVEARTGVRPVIEVLPQYGLFPRQLLLQQQDVVKPRALFGPDEDWTKAVIYH